MHPKYKRLVVVVAVAGIFLVVARLWHAFDSNDVQHPTNSPPITTTETSKFSGGMDLGRSTTTLNAGGSGRVAQPTANISWPSSSGTLRLSAVAPLDLQVGQVSDIRIDLQADGGVRELMFDVAFDKKRLVFVGSSEGNLIRQSSLSDAFAVEEPSDGNVHVSVKSGNGSPFFGNGTVAVLRVEAIKDGTSQITLQNVRAVDSGGASDLEAAVVQGTVVAIH